jgi:branched-chain amino acid aminotransferase
MIKNQKIYSWHNGKFLENAKVSAYNYTLHYGSPVAWEGIRAYLQSDGTTKILELKAHMERLIQSSKLMRMEINYSLDELMNACKELVARNGSGDQYIRPIVLPEVDAGDIVSGVLPKASVIIFSNPINAGGNKSVHLGWSPEVRGYPEHKMQIKTSSNYIHSADSLHRSKVSEFDDFLVRTKAGYVSETTVANIFCLKNGILMTPPNDGNILPGITRQRVSEMVNSVEFKSKLLKLGINIPIVVEKQLTTVDVQSADEMFMCGTYAEIIPVTKVDHIEIGNGSVGPLTKQIRESYQQSTRGNKNYLRLY